MSFLSPLQSPKDPVHIGGFSCPNTGLQNPVSGDSSTADQFLGASGYFSHLVYAKEKGFEIESKGSCEVVSIMRREETSASLSDFYMILNV